MAALTYNTQTISSIGQQIVVDAAAGQQAYLSYRWSTVDPYLPNALRTIDGEKITEKLLRRHVNRLGQPNASSQHIGTYDWQLQMGNTLKFIAAGINEQENNWADSIKGKVPT